ncbi:class I SAM-dependent methyltransferase [Chelatococcus sp.]|uniref:class I SAM-dependent methyltransferase n=1 Tax=Chelatococcus sp. TaxID=1953771 RepID=UPI001BD1AAE2|nr:class I SAM-dependent methyltransferase [Chelatococcus sp.]MBS7741135.1 class I SAM-dependent methyltransferase [Chelatococcus sp. HY11]MBX3545321.1 class I SAM-dependent methyltransferase [Chelatococcus sp.]CAH1660587.1 putative O-methyltransferase YrrM [Hyphomicrobiales bacterium]CAH1683376.1 putative O-methyltransferase YrrM [Hyphomicrobiales bacterium]
MSGRRLRRFWLGLRTLAGAARSGYFIPYRYARPARREPYAALEPLFTAATEQFEALLGEIERHAAALSAIPVEGEGLRWGQMWFPRLDAAAAYALVRSLRPNRIVEIGSGHSTRFLARAVSDGGLPTRITAIDPAPRASIKALPITHHAKVVEEVAPELITSLEAGDILFIDSSHVAMPGGDVDRLLLDILPRVTPGVVVHIHDIFLPDAYPAEWDWRGYNEQLVVGALMQGGGYETLFASRYVATRMAARVNETVLARLPLQSGAHETSLWLRKR